MNGLAFLRLARRPSFAVADADTPRSAWRLRFRSTVSWTVALAGSRRRPTGASVESP